MEKDLDALSQIDPSEKKKLVKYSLELNFMRGQIELKDSFFSIQLYQDELKIKVDIMRDTTFVATLTNKSVGVNVVTIESELEDAKVRQIVSKYERSENEQFKSV